MKKILFLLLSFLIGCDVNETTIPIEEGNYSGTFAIIEANGESQTGNVNFSFISNKYSVIPETRFLPPAGGGVYSVNNNVIIFSDTMPHTAEFDWTLILKGEFKFSLDDQVLTLRQNDIKYNRERIISLTKQKFK